MTLWLATYSNTGLSGVGTSIIATDDMPSFVKRYPDVEFRLYSREDDSILTPAVVAACVGTSDSL
jgi:hypothetical protein